MKRNTVCMMMNMMMCMCRMCMCVCVHLYSRHDSAAALGVSA